MEVNLILALLWTHWIFDFVLQTDKMALNKSTSVLALGSHCVVYTIGMAFFGVWFGIINGVAHFAIDFVTSRVTSYLWQKKDRHNFFVTIGFDQALHLTVLLYSAVYFGMTL